MRALIRNDLRIFINDRRAVIIGILVPILIAAFFGYIFGGGNARDDVGAITVAVVNEDMAALSDSIVSDLSKESTIAVLTLDRIEAEKRVRSGKIKVAVIVPNGFSKSAVRAFFVPGAKPTIEVLVDPSDRMSPQVVQGLFMQHAMRQISKEAFSGQLGADTVANSLNLLENTPNTNIPNRAELKALLESIQKLNAKSSTTATTTAPLQQGLSIPYSIKTTALTAKGNTPYNGYAHSFAGMTVQFILLAGVDAGVLLLLLRERGIWQRIRAAPLSRTELLLARAMGTALISLFQFSMIYLAAIAIFNVRIQGSLAGFVAIGVAFSIVNASFGLMLAALGRSAAATRGLAAMVALLLVMVGGAWVPAFVFPKWLQQASLFTPTRWAVDGLDAVTWRGLDFQSALAPVGVLLATAAICMSIAIWRFRWEE
jgi:ABC-2 type transport system permease protein